MSLKEPTFNDLAEALGPSPWPRSAKGHLEAGPNYRPPCRACGNVHVYGGEALQCDHDRGEHRVKPAIWRSADGVLVGCLACLEAEK